MAISMSCCASKLTYEMIFYYRWTFWYVYTLSHREKQKYPRKNRFNEYILHEVFSFGTVSIPY